MNILFLTLSQNVSDINRKGIYPDLLRKFAREGHNVFIVCPFERRTGKQTLLSVNGNVHTLGVKTLNITKSNLLEKGIGTILIESQYQKAIKKYFSDIQFDMVMYSTPPITFNKVIRFVKTKFRSKSYLLLKDIFPQNAVDLGMFSRKSLLHRFFRNKEKELYSLSDHIGCMSPANVDFILKHNPFIAKESVEVCPNSIELQPAESSTDKKDILSKYKIFTASSLFVFSGNLGKPQGIDFLIEVLDSNKNRKDVYFLIIGSGTESYKLDKWFDKVRPDNVKIIPDLPRKECDILTAACDIGLIFLDHRFTIPNYPSRLLTYLENKMPVLIATDTNTDIGNIAEQNGYGIRVESGDLKSFNEQLNYLIANKELFPAMGERGYKYLLDNYTVDKAYTTIMSHFD